MGVDQLQLGGVRERRDLQLRTGREHRSSRRWHSQGQSVFGAEGDTGAFSCIRSDGTTIADVLDPPSQPLVTSVGGTSLETCQPGERSRARGTPPWRGVRLEHRCPVQRRRAQRGQRQPGRLLLVRLGPAPGAAAPASGGAGPFYQVGTGGQQSQERWTANGTTQCALAKTGTPCREAPDVSANADEFTPYAEYCTGNANTPFSECGTFSGAQTPPGWFGIGGTSQSSPLWSAIIADRDSFQGIAAATSTRCCTCCSTSPRGWYFHDITGAGQTTTTNGLFPVVAGV